MRMDATNEHGQNKMNQIEEEEEDYDEKKQ